MVVAIQIRIDLSESAPARSGEQANRICPKKKAPVPHGNECLEIEVGDFAYDFTRFSVVGCSSISFPSISALQLLVIVSASSKLIVRACMCDSFVGLIPHVLSKSNLIVFSSEDFRTMPGRLPNMQ